MICRTIAIQWATCIRLANYNIVFIYDNIKYLYLLSCSGNVHS